MANVVTVNADASKGPVSICVDRGVNARSEPVRESWSFLDPSQATAQLAQFQSTLTQAQLDQLTALDRVTRA